MIWYLPIIKRFKRLFANINDTNNTRWNGNQIICDVQICHLTNSLKWKKSNLLFPDFSLEPMNHRLGLSNDKMNMFGNINTNYNSCTTMENTYNHGCEKPHNPG